MSSMGNRPSGTALPRDARPMPAHGYRIEELDGELLLYQPETRHIAYCNASAALVWRLCDGRRTVQDIVDLLAAAYPDDAARVSPDVDEILARLAAEGLVWIEPEAG